MLIRSLLLSLTDINYEPALYWILGTQTKNKTQPLSEKVAIQCENYGLGSLEDVCLKGKKTV